MNYSGTKYKQNASPSDFLIKQRVKCKEQRAKSNEQRAKCNEKRAKPNNQQAKANERRAKNNDQQATSKTFHLLQRTSAWMLAKSAAGDLELEYKSSLSKKKLIKVYNFSISNKQRKSRRLTSYLTLILLLMLMLTFFKSSP